jgi:hypothetical protein
MVVTKVQLQNKNENTRNLKKVQYKFKDGNFQTTTIICIVPKKKPAKRKIEKKRQGVKCSLEINYLSMEMNRFSYLGLDSHLIVNKSCENMLLRADFGFTLGKKNISSKSTLTSLGKQLIYTLNQSLPVEAGPMSIAANHSEM